MLEAEINLQYISAISILSVLGTLISIVYVNVTKKSYKISTWWISKAY
jgi:hypothetical protein